jgi:hypothetical protein
MLALPFGAWTSHWPASPQANERQLRARQDGNGEEKAGRRRAKKTAAGDKYHMWGRRRNGRTDNFTLTVSSQFQDTAETYVSHMS